MKKSSGKKSPPKASDLVHSKLGSLSKLLATFKTRAHAARFGSNIARQCQPDAETRAFLLRLLDAATKDDVGKSVYATQELNLGILRFVLKDDFTAEEVPYLHQLICNYSSTRHISGSYDAEIDEFFSLPDARLEKFLETLLSHEMPSLRASALELLGVAWNRNRLRSWIVDRVARYKDDNPTRDSLEDAYLDTLAPLMEAKAPAPKKKPKP